MHVRRRAVPSVIAAVVVASAAVGCAGGSDAEEPASSSAVASVPESMAADPTLAALVPAPIRQSRKLTVATDAPYAPMVFTDDGQLVGFDVDVITRVAEILGLQPDITQIPFSDIVSGVGAGRFDTAARSITDTLARERDVDMVTYYRAGNQWVQRAGGQVDPNNACGLTVAVEKGTVEQTVSIPAKSAACTTLGGKAIDIVSVDSEQAAADAVLSGRADALSADSPIALYLADRSDGRLAPAGTTFDTLPLAFPVAKGAAPDSASSLGRAMQGAVQKLIDSGALEQIARQWGIEEGVIATSTINGALD